MPDAPVSTRAADTRDWADRFRALEATNERIQGERNAEHVQAQALTELVHRLEERVRVLEGRNGEHSEKAAGWGDTRCEAETSGVRCDLKAGHPGIHRHDDGRVSTAWIGYDDSTPDQQSPRPSGSEQPEEPTKVSGRIASVELRPNCSLVEVWVPVGDLRDFPVASEVDMTVYRGPRPVRRASAGSEQEQKDAGEGEGEDDASWVSMWNARPSYPIGAVLPREVSAAIDAYRDAGGSHERLLEFLRAPAQEEQGQAGEPVAWLEETLVGDQWRPWDIYQRIPFGKPETKYRRWVPLYKQERTDGE